MSGTALDITASCHCGAVHLSAHLPEGLKAATRCTCSFCARRQAAAVTATTASVRVTKGAENLTLYTWGTGTAQHYFCKTCGIDPFHRPRIAPDSYTVNVNCLDDVDDDQITNLEIIRVDGRSFSTSK